MSEQQSQPELLGLEVLEPAALALRIPLEDFVACLDGVQRCAGTLIVRAHGNLWAFGMDCLCDYWSGVDVFAFTKEALSGVSLRLGHLDVSFVILTGSRANRNAECGEWSFSTAT